jgi:hypothetical protein
MTNYTFDNALADLAAILEGTTAEVTEGYKADLPYLADGFCLLERYGLRVGAILMCQENLDALLVENGECFSEGDPTLGSSARIWNAEIFCPLMSNDVAYCLALAEQGTPTLLKWSQINLEAIRREPHSAYDDKGRRVA